MRKKNQQSEPPHFYIYEPPYFKKSWVRPWTSAMKSPCTKESHFYRWHVIEVPFTLSLLTIYFIDFSFEERLLREVTMWKGSIVVCSLICLYTFEAYIANNVNLQELSDHWSGFKVFASTIKSSLKCIWIYAADVKSRRHF